MDITISVRHFEINNEIKQYATDMIEGAFADLRLKIASASMVLDMQRNQVSASLTVNIKDNPVSSNSSAYDNPYKAIEEVVTKTATQAKKYLDKKQDHKGVSLKETELNKAEE